MASTASPYGLIPVKRVDGLPYAGAVSEYLIDSGYGTNIYYGSVVHLDANGYVAIVTGTGADATNNDWPTGTSSGMTGALGVFVGCEYINAQGQLVHSNYFPTGTTSGGNDIKCSIVDDPMVLFRAQLSGAADQTDIGANTFFNAAQSTSTGSTTTGKSNSALAAATVTTTAAFRIVGAHSPIGDAFPDVLVKINPGWHKMSVDKGL